MSKFKLVALAFALTLSGLAMAALDPLTNIVEVQGADFRAPAHEADQVVLRSCKDCKALSLKVTAATVYRVSGFKSLPVALPTFQNTMRKASKSELQLIYVAYEPSSRIVTEIVLERPESAGDDGISNDASE